MALTYASTRRAKEAPVERRAETGAEGPSLAALAAGAAPTAPQMGRQADLPGGIREKMENSFGAEFSNVKLYESQTVADAGAEAVTQGSNIAFAPGKLDLSSTAGQALLGHELSHVVSQARGESAGQGFLNDPGLEAQADRQGMMAAQGQSVFSGPVSPIGGSSASAAAGPMQAKKDKTPRTKDGTDVSEFAEGPLNINFVGEDAAASRNLTDDFAQNILDNMGDISDQALFNPDFMKYVSTRAGENARDDMASVQGENSTWNQLAYAGFRGRSQRNSETGRAFQNLTNHIAYRGLEGGKAPRTRKDKKGRLRTNLSSRLSPYDGEGNLDTITQALLSPENQGIVDMLTNYQEHAFAGSDPDAGGLDYGQRSAMIMNNVISGFGSAAYDAGEYNEAGSGSRAKAPLTAALAAAERSSILQDRAISSAGDTFLSLLTPDFADMTNDDNGIVDGTNDEELNRRVEREPDYGY